MAYTREQLEFLREWDRGAHLLNMKHTPGWEVFCQLAEQRIKRMEADYIREDATKDQVYERHLKLKAVMEFWNVMSEMVDNSERITDPEELKIRLYSLSPDPDLT